MFCRADRPDSWTAARKRHFGPHRCLFSLPLLSLRVVPLEEKKKSLSKSFSASSAAAGVRRQHTLGEERAGDCPLADSSTGGEMVRNRTESRAALYPRCLSFESAARQFCTAAAAGRRAAAELVHSGLQPAAVQPALQPAARPAAEAGGLSAQLGFTPRCQPCGFLSR